MDPARPHPWEAVYPPGLDWGAPIRTTTLGTLLEESAAAHADRVALRYRDSAIGYPALLSAARRVAGVLAGLPEARGGIAPEARGGIAPEARGGTIALLTGNTAFHPILVFGAAMAGLRVVMLSPIDAPRTIAHKLRDSGARVLVTLAHEGLLKLSGALVQMGLVDRLVVGDDAHWGAGPASPPVPEGALRIEDWLAAPEPASLPAVTPEDIMLLQYTGGTTGLPKGAMLTHANLTAAAGAYVAWNGGRGPAGDRRIRRMVGVLPLFHIFAFTVDLVLTLQGGHELLIHARFDADAVLDDISIRKATDMAGVPTMWIALANHPEIDKRDLSSLQSAGSGGAPLPPEVAARFERLTGMRLGGGWGMTETAPAGTSVPGRPDLPPRPGSIGIPVPNVEMRIVAMDDPRRVLPPGETGEIAIRGPNVFKGYWNRPEETARAFVDVGDGGRWFLTGDVGRMEPDGFFFLTERKKDMILSGGFNVYPSVIEAAIHEHPDVVEAAVIGIPDPYRGQSAKAFVTLRPGAAALTLEALQAFLADRVGKHEMPVALETRDELPKTPVGKLTKLPLIEEEAARTASAS